MTNPDDPDEQLKESEKLSECPECGEPANVFGIKISVLTETDTKRASGCVDEKIKELVLVNFTV